MHVHEPVQLAVVAEASDHLTRAEEILLGFSRKPDQVDAEAINACFRSLHTIKGCSGFLDLERIQRLAHAGEQVLDALRTQTIRGSLAVFDALLMTVARLQAHIAQLNGTTITVPDSDADCIHHLDEISAKPAAAAPLSPAQSGPLEAISTAISELIVSGVDDPRATAAARERELSI